ncbi:hypothetical protein BN1723_020499, partial [Verticillium longisporum]
HAHDGLPQRLRASLARRGRLCWKSIWRLQHVPGRWIPRPAPQQAVQVEHQGGRDPGHHEAAAQAVRGREGEGRALWRLLHPRGCHCCDP